MGGVHRAAQRIAEAYRRAAYRSRRSQIPSRKAGHHWLRTARGRERTVHARYAALASHVLFAAKFCRPRTPPEKPRVENRVKDLERM